MRFEHTISMMVSRVLGRFARRAAAAAVVVIFLLAALYHLTVAGTLGLADHFGPINARLIIAGAYLLIGVAIVAGLYATRARPISLKQRGSPERAPLDVQIAMLIESVLLGYTAERGKSRQR